MDIKRLTRKNIKKIKPYNVKVLAGKVKLDANESPFGYPSFIEAAKNVPTNRYPDPDGKDLKREISKKWKIGMKNILLGNGSDELIYYLITTFGGPVLFPVPTFSMYSIITTALGEKQVTVALDSEFDINLKKITTTIKRYNPKLIFLSSPNNPTGNCFSEEKIEEVINLSKGIVVIDEAYQPFSKRNHINYIKRYSNVAIIRTLSKIGFANLRVGFLIGHTKMIEIVNKVRLPFNVNGLSQAIALHIFKNYSKVQSSIDEIVKEREQLYKRLKEFEEIEVFPSEANFILFRVKRAKTIYKKLAQKGVLIKDMTEEIKNGLRVTVGLAEENDIFIKTLSDIIRRKK